MLKWKLEWKTSPTQWNEGGIWYWYSWRMKVRNRNKLNYGAVHNKSVTWGQKFRSSNGEWAWNGHINEVWRDSGIELVGGWGVRRDNEAQVKPWSLTLDGLTHHEIICAMSLWGHGTCGGHGGELLWVQWDDQWFIQWDSMRLRQPN